MIDSTHSDLPGISFIRYVLEALVLEKDKLVIEAKEDDMGILLTIQVSDSDMGKLIGKSGQTIKALRTLVRTIGSNSAKRINLKVLEPENAQPA